MATNIYASTGGKPVEGAWYGNQRYMNGALMAPGQIDPGSPPTNKDQVTPYLNSYQKDLLANSSAPQTRVQTADEVKAELKPDTPLPELLNRSQRFGELRTEYGVSALEENLNLLKGEQDDLYAQNRINQNSQRGQGVAQNVVEGRIGELERSYQERADYLGRQVSRITDELNTKYNVINMFMNFESLDYNDAVKRYEDEFSRNLQVYGIIDGQRKQARSEYEYDQQAARANLQIYSNAITSGNLSASSMSADQKLMLNKLEVQSGLPIGFVSSLNMSAKDRLININEKTGEALVVGENGGFQVIQTGFRSASGSGSGGGSGKVDTTTLRSGASQYLDLAKNSYGHVGPATWQKAVSAYTQGGGTREDFIKNFGQYADPYAKNFQSSYGFASPLAK